MLFLISCVIKFGLFPSQTNFIAIVDTQHVERPPQELDHFPLIFLIIKIKDKAPTMRPTIKDATRSVHSICS